MKGPDKTSRWSVRIAAIILVFFLCSLTLEGLSRIFFYYKAEVGGLLGKGYFSVLEKTLDPYEMASSKGYPHWVLRPGFEAGAKSVTLSKLLSGKILGAAAFATDDRQSDIRISGIRVNADGFRGPEILPDHTHLRVLMLGDSVTFGLANTTYPDIVSEILLKNGFAAEIINGGVEGYSIRNLEIELDKYLSLKPDVITIFIGWNDLYSEYQYPDTWYFNFSSVRVLYRLVSIAGIWLFDDNIVVNKMYAKRENVNFNDAGITDIQNVVPPYIDRLIKLARRFQEDGGQVLLMTLPGLFSMKEPPSDKALKIGHLPMHIENPIIFSALTERVNTMIMQVSALNRIPIIDLSGWSENALKPRHDYFLDSVHFTAEGLHHVGEFVAQQLCGHVQEIRMAVASCDKL